MPGKITVFTGPMFSRKTKSMVVELERAILGRKKFLVLKPNVDLRSTRSLEGELEKTLGPLAVNTKELIYRVSGQMHVASLRVQSVLRPIDIIAIDEAQFFGSWIVDEVKLLAWDWNKRILISGLDLNHKREGFGSMPELIAIADEVHKLTAVCLKCGRLARFTQKISGSADTKIEVGDKELYEARCGDCYYGYYG